MNFKEICLSMAFVAFLLTSPGFASEPCVSQLERDVRSRTSPFRADTAASKQPVLASMQVPMLSQIGLTDQPLIVEPDLALNLADLFRIHGYPVDSQGIAETITAMYARKHNAFLELCNIRTPDTSWVIRRVQRDDGSVQTETNTVFLYGFQHGVKFPDTFIQQPGDKKNSLISEELQRHESDVDTTYQTVLAFLTKRNDDEASVLKEKLTRNFRAYQKAMKMKSSDHTENIQRLHSALRALADVYGEISVYACSNGT